MNELEWTHKEAVRLRAYFRELRGEFLRQQPDRTVKLEDLRAAWCYAAITEWSRMVHDRDDGHEADPHIANYFRNASWQWYLDAYGDGEYVETYTVEVNGEQVVRFMEWCGAFQAYCGRMVGVVLGEFTELMGAGMATLHRDIATYIMPGTPRFNPDGQFWQKTSALDTLQPFEDADEPRAGDVLTVGKGRWGNHIVLCIARDGNKVLCIEGNGRGTFPDGTRGEGVVAKVRDRDEVVRCWRYGAQHFSGV